MNQLKNSLDKHILNESDMLARIRLGNAQAELRRRQTMRRKMFLSVGTAAAMLVLILAVWNFLSPATGILPAVTSAGGTSARSAASTAAGTTSRATTAPTTAATQGQAYAMVSIDINPSLELYLNKAGQVLEIKTRNKDAETLSVKGLIGKPLEEATTSIVAQATEKGFIKSNDAVDDYVIASTVILDESDPAASQDQDNFGSRIRDAIAAADLSTTTKVAVIKATLQEKHQADKNGVPLGLSIINGMIKNESGVMVSVADFVKDQNNLKQLAKRAAIAAAHSTRPGATAPGESNRNTTASGSPSGSSNQSVPPATLPNPSTQPITLPASTGATTIPPRN